MRICWFFIWTNLNPFHPRMLCAKFGWNWPSSSGEEDKMWKSLRCLIQQQRRRKRRRITDKFWLEQLICAFGSGELKKKPKKNKLKRYILLLIYYYLTVYRVLDSPSNHSGTGTSPQQTQTPNIGNTFSKFTDTNLAISYKYTS